MKAVAPGDAGRARRRLRQHRAARSSATPRVFDDVDFITLDDGERAACSPWSITCAIPRARCSGPTCARPARSSSQSTPALADLHHRDTGTPTYDGLPLDRYVSLFEMLNPMHRLWSDGRWNKLTVAHGCYWKQCTFCDVVARLHRALRAGVGGRHSSTGSRRWSRETGETGLPLRRRGGAARDAARARRAPHRAAGRDHLVGQHPLREATSPRSSSSCSRAPAASP